MHPDSALSRPGRRSFLAAFGATAAMAALTPPGRAAVVNPRDPGVEAAADQTAAPLFGAAVQPGVLRPGSAGRAIIEEQCASITPEWAMKWNALASTGPEYDFTEADACADFARNAGKRLRGHTLLWHQGTPAWARARIALDRDWTVVQDHISKVVGRYAPLVSEWDVVNEPIADDGDGPLRDTVFLSAYGPDYIERAFHAAAAAAPGADLFINDYGLEYASDGRKRLALLHTLDALLETGTPITGLGLQSHLDLRKGTIDENGVYGLVRDISGMGLKMAVTELDVREADFSLDVARRDALVADTVRAYLAIVLQFPVTSVTTWGLSDADSWLAYRQDGHPDNRGLPYDAHWQPKPMLAAINAVVG